MATSNLITAADHDFKLYQGDYWSCQLVFTDNSSNPIDLSGGTIKMQIKVGKGVADYIKQLTIGNGLTLSGAGNNTITINTTVDFDARSYVYDLQVEFSDKVVTYLKGTITVTEDVTR